MPTESKVEKPQVSCYNKGCGKQFDPSDNQSETCLYHPGVPVFHDALKGWSCCDKKSTDFTQFLNFPGCTKGAHTNMKPVEPAKIEEPVTIVLPKTTSTDRKIIELTPRPAVPSALVEMRRTVAPSLLAALVKLNEAKVEASGEKIVTAGTSCKNAACKAEYVNEASNTETCFTHPGVAVFHEGMKYWSCCNKKTCDFEAFLSQEGCQESTHLWFKKESNEKQTNCRSDYHQVSGFFIVTFYAKNVVPDKTCIKLNETQLELSLCFEGGSKSFKKVYELFGVVNIAESVVNLFQTKVEIKLKKADLINWDNLEHKAK